MTFGADGSTVVSGSSADITGLGCLGAVDGIASIGYLLYTKDDLPVSNVSIHTVNGVILVENLRKQGPFPSTGDAATDASYPRSQAFLDKFGFTCCNSTDLACFTADIMDDSDASPAYTPACGGSFVSIPAGDIIAPYITGDGVEVVAPPDAPAPEPECARVDPCIRMTGDWIRIEEKAATYHRFDESYEQYNAKITGDCEYDLAIEAVLVGSGPEKRFELYMITNPSYVSGELNSFTPVHLGYGPSFTPDGWCPPYPEGIEIDIPSIVASPVPGPSDAIVRAAFVSRYVIPGAPSTISVSFYQSTCDILPYSHHNAPECIAFHGSDTDSISGSTDMKFTQTATVDTYAPLWQGATYDTDTNLWTDNTYTIEYDDDVDAYVVNNSGVNVSGWKKPCAFLDGPLGRWNNGASENIYASEVPNCLMPFEDELYEPPPCTTLPETVTITFETAISGQTVHTATLSSTNPPQYVSSVDGTVGLIYEEATGKWYAYTSVEYIAEYSVDPDDICWPGGHYDPINGNDNEATVGVVSATPLYYLRATNSLRKSGGSNATPTNGGGPYSWWVFRNGATGATRSLPTEADVISGGVTTFAWDDARSHLVIPGASNGLNGLDLASGSSPTNIYNNWAETFVFERIGATAHVGPFFPSKSPSGDHFVLFEKGWDSDPGAGTSLVRRIYVGRHATWTSTLNDESGAGGKTADTFGWRFPVSIPLETGRKIVLTMLVWIYDAYNPTTHVATGDVQKCFIYLNGVEYEGTYLPGTTLPTWYGTGGNASYSPGLFSANTTGENLGLAEIDFHDLNPPVAATLAEARAIALTHNRSRYEHWQLLTPPL